MRDILINSILFCLFVTNIGADGKKCDLRAVGPCQSREDGTNGVSLLYYCYTCAFAGRLPWKETYLLDPQRRPLEFLSLIRYPPTSLDRYQRNNIDSNIGTSPNLRHRNGAIQGPDHIVLLRVRYLKRLHWA
jgi:hypothetical protein